MKLAIRLALLITPLMGGVLASAPAEAQVVRGIDRQVFDGAPAEGYVPTPYGWTHESCVYIAANNARVTRSGSDGLTVSRSDGSTSAELPPCRFKAIRGGGPHVVSVSRQDLSDIGDKLPPPTVVNWALASGAYSNPGTYFTQIHTTWQVPPPPSKPGALLYFFNGLEPSDGRTVIQPVLQWGRSPAGGGNYWAATSWMVQVGADDKQNVLRSEVLTPLAPGDQLTGHVNAYECNQNGNCSWSIWLDGPRGVFGWLNVSNMPVMTWAVRAAAEFYFLSSCEQLPVSRSITFSNNRVVDSRGREVDRELPWKALGWPITPNCGNNAEHFPGGAKLLF